MREIIKVCQLCKKEFKTTRDNAKFCSNDCRIKAQSTSLNVLRRRRIIECKECGKKREVRNYTKTKFCSKECSIEYQKKHTNKKDEKDLNKRQVKCKHCGKEYLVWNYRKNSCFCSSECQHLHGRITEKCKYCGKSYSSTRWENTGFCSSECRKQTINKRISKLEKTIFDYLKIECSNHLIENNSYIKINDRRIFPDILIDKKIVIECYGDYWHCNPDFYNDDYFHKQIRKTAKEIRSYDNERRQFLEQNGYKTIVLWENDIETKKITLNEVKNMIYEIKV